MTVSSLLVMKVTVLLLACMTGSVSADYRRSACGQRLSGVRTLNVTVKDVFSVDKFTSDYETFPWLVPIKMTNSGREPTLLCSAVAISSYVALAPGQVTDSNFFAFFIKSLIYPEGKSITPHRSGHCSLLSLPATPWSQSWTLDGLFELTQRPSPRALLPERKRHKDTVIGGALDL